MSVMHAPPPTPAPLAYLLATTRRDQYYLDVAPHLQAIKDQACLLNRVRGHRIGLEALWDWSVLVWHQSCGNEAAAQSRIAEIRAWPHRWQRRLIESENPYWLDQSLLLATWPVAEWWVVPETMPTTRPKSGPHGVPPEAIEQLMARYGCEAAFPPDWMQNVNKPKLRSVR